MLGLCTSILCYVQVKRIREKRKVEGKKHYHNLAPYRSNYLFSQKLLLLTKQNKKDLLTSEALENRGVYFHFSSEITKMNLDIQK